MPEKTIDYSRTRISQVMLPGQANFAGNVHGGEVMKMMDTTAFVVARKHARSNVVTARVDELVFHLPIFVGELVSCTGEIVYTGKSSMEIFVRVEVEDLDNDDAPKTALSAFFTMVALDNKGKPRNIPAIALQDEKEKCLWEKGRERYLAHKTRKEKIGGENCR